MRELSFLEIGFVAGGPTAPTGAPPPAPVCPAGSSMTGTTYPTNGGPGTITCTPNSQIPSQNVDWSEVWSEIEALCEVVLVVIAVSVLKP